MQKEVELLWYADGQVAQGKQTGFRENMSFFCEWVSPFFLFPPWAMSENENKDTRARWAHHFFYSKSRPTNFHDPTWFPRKTLSGNEKYVDLCIENLRGIFFWVPWGIGMFCLLTKEWLREYWIHDTVFDYCILRFSPRRYSPRNSSHFLL